MLLSDSCLSLVHQQYTDCSRWYAACEDLSRCADCPLFDAAVRQRCMQDLLMLVVPNGLL